MAAKPDFGRIVKANNLAMGVHVGFAALILAAGGALLFGASALPFLQDAEAGSTIVKVGGGFVGVLSTFPIRDFIARLRHNSGVRMVSDLWDTVHATATPDPAAVKRLDDLVWKMLEKEALG